MLLPVSESIMSIYIAHHPWNSLNELSAKMFLASTWKRLRWGSGCGQGSGICSRRTDRQWRNSGGRTCWVGAVARVVDLTRRNGDVCGWTVAVIVAALVIGLFLQRVATALFYYMCRPTFFCFRWSACSSYACYDVLKPGPDGGLIVWLCGAACYSEPSPTVYGLIWMWSPAEQRQSRCFLSLSLSLSMLRYFCRANFFVWLTLQDSV